MNFETEMIFLEIWGTQAHYQICKTWLLYQNKGFQWMKYVNPYHYRRQVHPDRHKDSAGLSYEDH